MTFYNTIPWIRGGLPHGWAQRPVKSEFEIRLGKMLQTAPLRPSDQMVAYLKAQHVRWGSLVTNDLPSMWASPTEISDFSISEGDLLVCEGGDVGRATIVDAPLESTTIIQNALHRVRPKKNNDARYLMYVLRHAASAGWFEVISNKATIAHLTVEKLGSLEIPLPSPTTQRSIANFLDRKTASIDALIHKKERLVELLQEQRQSLITRAVTKGLDPSVKMKDSGHEWLGLIPAHWNIKRLMHLTPDHRRIMYGIVLPGPDFEGGVPIVKSGDCHPERLRLENLSRTNPEIEASYVRSRLDPGDIVYAIRGSIGSAAQVPTELRGANLTQDAARISPRRGIDSSWLFFAVQSNGVWAQLQEGVIGATVKGINIRDLKRPLLPVPPLQEQREIADFLTREAGLLDNLINATSTSCTALYEYQQALISAAVSGKIEVPELDIEASSAEVA